MKIIFLFAVSLLALSSCVPSLPPNVTVKGKYSEWRTDADGNVTVELDYAK